MYYRNIYPYAGMALRGYETLAEATFNKNSDCVAQEKITIIGDKFTVEIV